MKALLVGLALCAFSANSFAKDPAATAAPAPEAGMTAGAPAGEVPSAGAEEAKQGAHPEHKKGKKKKAGAEGK